MTDRKTEWIVLTDQEIIMKPYQAMLAACILLLLGLSAGFCAGKAPTHALMAEGERLLERVHELEMEKIQAEDQSDDRGLTLLFPGDLDHRSKLVLMEELIDLCLEDPWIETFVPSIEEGVTDDQE